MKSVIILLLQYPHFIWESLCQVEAFLIYLRIEIFKNNTMNIRYVHQFSLLNQVFLFLLLQTLFMSTVCAQEIVVKDIPSLDKLPVKAIHRIFQDSDGYIW